MTLDERKALAGKLLRQAQRLSDRAQERWATGDALMAEANRLCAEVDDLLAGRPPRSREPRPLPVRH